MGEAGNDDDRNGDREYKLERLRLRYQLYNRLILIPQMALPLIPVIWIAKAFAGRQTTLTVGISVAITVALSGIIGLSNLSLRRKLRQQGRELQRIRLYARELEGRLGLPPRYEATEVTK